MKLSLIACASFVILTAFALTTESVLADANSGAVTHRRQHGLLTIDQKPGLTCPTGEIVYTDPTTGRQSCVQPDMAVKNSGVPKNTTTAAPGTNGNATAAPLNNRQN
jgi:hypothetical protein